MPNLGLARLKVARRHGRSVVVEQYSQAPLQLHRPLYLGGAETPTVFLKSPSSGLLDGDEHRLTVELAEQSVLELRTQAATLVYPGDSIQEFRIKISDAASLVFLPHPLILAQGARLLQRVRIDLASPQASLLFSESWAAGRISMGESFKFVSFDNELEIYVAGKISYREKWIMTPNTMPVDHPLVCGSFTSFRSIFAFGPQSQLVLSKYAQDALEAPQTSPLQHWKLEQNCGTVTRMAF